VTYTRSKCVSMGSDFHCHVMFTFRKTNIFRYLSFQVLSAVNGILSYDVTPCILLEID